MAINRGEVCNPLAQLTACGIFGFISYESWCYELALSCLRTPVSLAATAAGGFGDVPPLCAECGDGLFHIFGYGLWCCRCACASAGDPGTRA